MAISSTIICDTCHQRKDEMHDPSKSSPTTCTQCGEKKATEARQLHLDELTRLSTEERLRKVEEFIYDHQRSYHPQQPWRG
jgi:hypothetical protein